MVLKLCKRSSLLLWLALLSVVLLCSCKGSEEPAGAALEKPEKVVPVKVEAVQPLDLTDTFTLPAGLEAKEDLTLAAEIAGPIRAIHFQEGQRVRAGQVLLEIDPQSLQSSLARDQQNYVVLQRKLTRYRDLIKDGLISPQQLDELENSVTAAEMALQATRLQLDKCFPKAPIGGIIDRHYIDRGEYVDPGKPLMRLVQIDQLKAIAEVPEKDIAYLKVGQTVEIIPAVINELSAEPLQGRIEYIAYAAEEATRTYQTKIVLDNGTGLLRPGMIVRVRFVRQQLQQVLAIPLYAVLDRDGGKQVFVAENGIARKLTVETGSSVNQRIVIRAGLSAGQQLIVKGQQLLIDGARIAVEEN